MRVLSANTLSPNCNNQTKTTNFLQTIPIGEDTVWMTVTGLHDVWIFGTVWRKWLTGQDAVVLSGHGEQVARSKGWWCGEGWVVEAVSVLRRVLAEAGSGRRTSRSREMLWLGQEVLGCDQGIEHRWFAHATILPRLWVEFIVTTRRHGQEQDAQAEGEALSNIHGERDNH